MFFKLWAEVLPAVFCFKYNKDVFLNFLAIN